MNNDREPNNDAISFREVEDQNVSADTELDQGHAIEIQDLRKPQVMEVCLQVVRGEDWIPDMATTTNIIRFIREDGTDYC